MPVSWEIREGLLIVAVVGDWSGGGPASAIAQALADSRFKPGTALLLDVRSSTMNPAGDMVRSRTAWIASLRHRGLSSRCAVVVGSKPYQLGVARMAQAYLEYWEMDLKIFTGVSEAVDWLRAPPAAEANHREHDASA